MSKILQPKATDFLMSFSVAIRDEKQPKSEIGCLINYNRIVEIDYFFGFGIPLPIENYLWAFFAKNLDIWPLILI